MRHPPQTKEITVCKIIVHDYGTFVFSRKTTTSVEVDLPIWISDRLIWFNEMDWWIIRYYSELFDRKKQGEGMAETTLTTMAQAWPTNTTAPIQLTLQNHGIPFPALRHGKHPSAEPQSMSKCTSKQIKLYKLKFSSLLATTSIQQCHSQLHAPNIPIWLATLQIARMAMETHNNTSRLSPVVWRWCRKSGRQSSQLWRWMWSWGDKKYCH
jgi:hypothetical protein